MLKESKKKSILLCIGIVIVYLIVYNLLGIIASSVFSITKENSPFWDTIIYAIMIIFLCFIMKKTNKTYVLEEKGKGFKNGLRVGKFLVVFESIIAVCSFISNVGGNSLRPIIQILFFIISVTGTGLTEEFLFRGIVQNILLDTYGRKEKKSIITGIMISSLIFGTMHLINIFSGVSVNGAIIQALSTISIGFYFGAVYVRCKNIWSVAFLHALLDFVGEIQVGIFGINSLIDQVSSNTNPLSVVFSLVFLIIGLWLLRKDKIQECIEETNE